MLADWSETNLNRLRFAWEAGFTAREIAEQFGDGRSRNSIIGMAHRLGLPPRAAGAWRVRPGRPIKDDAKGGQLLGRGYRKAYISKGDDPRCRFVRVDQGEHGRKRRVTKPRLPGFEAPFIQEGRTKFAKSVQAPDKNILVSGHNNIKIGKIVRKGPLKGSHIFTLSIEERKTCPASCKHWQNCYGNNMPFAKRVDHTHPDFLPKLEAALEKLCATGAKKGYGILVRLHALGDFFSTEYVNFWCQMLVRFPNLALYGYTARLSGTAIGWQVNQMNETFPTRSFIRFSDGGMSKNCTVSIGEPESCPPNAFVCPEQTGKTLGCDTCGLCWGTRKNVAFLEH
jgi:hypothetical protein